MLETELLDAYHNTHYTIGNSNPFTLRIGQYAAPLSQLYREHGVASAAVVTAANPFSRRVTDAENTTRRQTLQSVLLTGGWHYLDCTARDPARQWPDEHGFLILGMPCDAASSLGRQFRQNAIVFCASDAIPALVILV